jgi:hypothetical protein
MSFHFQPRRFLVVWMACIFGASAARSAPKTPPLAAPPLVYSIPSAVAPGASVDVTWYGGSLGKPIGMWTSFPAAATVMPSEKGQANYHITVAQDVAVGLGAVRLLTTAGASNLRLLLIDDLPTSVRKGGNTTFADAQVVSTPIAIDCACEPLAADCYRIAGRKGQRLCAEIVAQRLGSRMDAIMRLLDSSGRELVYCDDSPGAGSDPQFACTFPADGNYTLEVRDVNYDGGPEYRYRLRLGNFPIVTCAFPPAGQRGSKATFTLEGPGCESLTPLTVAVPNDRLRLWLGAKLSQGQGSALTPLLCSDLEERVEVEPNDSLRNATKVAFPGAVSGHFQQRGDSDFYQFHASGGSKISIRGFTREIGSPANLSLQLLDSKAKLLAESKVNGPDEASIEAIVASDGDYFVCARELSGGGGPAMVYRLELRPIKAGFSLSTDVEVLNMPQGSAKLKVTAVRRDYNGPIKLLVAGEAQRVELENNFIAAGKSEIELDVKAPIGAVTDRPIQFSIMGTAQIDGSNLQERVSTMPALTTLFPRMSSPPPELDGITGLGVLKAKD